MPINSILPNEHLKPRAHAPAGGSNLIVSFNNGIVGQTTTSFASSAKVVHGEEAYTQAEVTTLYHGNQQYSVTAISDSSGNVSERYAYTAYGQPTFLNASGAVQTSSAANNRYTYTGREWDSTLGLHYFRARWMSGLSGRFLSRDPIGFKGGLISLYLYVRSNPTKYLDPSGLCGELDDIARKRKKCWDEFDGCLADSVAERNRCIAQAASDARDLIRMMAEEALRQFEAADRIASQTRDSLIAYCAVVNDRTTLFGEIAYQSCVASAWSGYSTASTAALVIYTAATAELAATALSYEAGRVAACLALYVIRNGNCDDQFSACIHKIIK